MEMKITLVAALFTAVLAATVAGADTAEKCYVGGQETGVLKFAGAVEGSSFNGGFGEFSVTYCMADGDPAGGQIDVEVELATADTDNRDRDQTLKGEEFFAVDEYPQATWRSLAIERDGDGYVGDGELELKGIRAGQPVRFTLAPDGDAIVARGEFTIQGAAEVDRQRFNVGTGEFADPEFVRNRVDVSFEVLLLSDE